MSDPEKPTFDDDEDINELGDAAQGDAVPATTGSPLPNLVSKQTAPHPHDVPATADDHALDFDDEEASTLAVSSNPFDDSASEDAGALPQDDDGGFDDDDDVVNSFDDIATSGDADMDAAGDAEADAGFPDAATPTDSAPAASRFSDVSDFDDGEEAEAMPGLEDDDDFGVGTIDTDEPDAFDDIPGTGDEPEYDAASDVDDAEFPGDAAAEVETIPEDDLLTEEAGGFHGAGGGNGGGGDGPLGDMEMTPGERIQRYFKIGGAVLGGIVVLSILYGVIFGGSAPPPGDPVRTLADENARDQDFGFDDVYEAQPQQGPDEDAADRLARQRLAELDPERRRQTDLEGRMREEPPASGPSRRAWEDFVTSVIEPTARTFNSRLDDLSTRVGHQDERIDDMMNLQLALREDLDRVSGKLLVTAGPNGEEGEAGVAKPAAGTAPATTPAARPVAAGRPVTPNPEVVFSEYAISSPDGILTEAVLTFGEGTTRVPRSSDLRINTGRVGSTSNYFAEIDVPKAIVQQRAPRARGFIREAANILHPNYRRFRFVAGEPIAVELRVTDVALEILMGPHGGATQQDVRYQRALRSGDAQLAARAIRGQDHGDGLRGGIARDPETGAIVYANSGTGVRPGAVRSSAPQPADRIQARRGQPLRAPRVASDDTSWRVMAMTERMAMIMHTRTGQRMNVVEGTKVPGLGQVMALDVQRKAIHTETGVIRQ